MKSVVAVVAAVAVCAAALALLVPGDEPLPSIGPRVEPICEQVMRTAPDLSRRAPGHDELSRGRETRAVTLSELPLHSGELVSVEGLLHAEFEWAALYPSRAALEDGWREPWVALESLWPNEAG
jgi:hypothetical protein